MRFNLVYWSGNLLTRILCLLFFRPRISGQDNVPRKGGFILASNHISYYDPPLVGSWQRREVYFFAKKELFRNWLFGAIITAANSLPVSRGVVDRKAIKAAVEVIQAGFGLTMFPEGTRSLTDQFLDPKPGVGIIAIQAGCPIIPVYLHGSNRLGDCFRGKDKLSVSYGSPLSAEWVRSQGSGKEAYLKIATTVMERISDLRSAVTDVK
ncbi:MAG: 1-acyl-sn-glycerol-3-phosphate acyltransferase [candidate division Zixibacteria bacterium]|nr:1-acyl-sn-glycerol-3-phosphate acyltransferase [candidate division Zixibacteria bacterium]